MVQITSPEIVDFKRLPKPFIVRYRTRIGLLLVLMLLPALIFLRPVWPGNVLVREFVFGVLGFALMWAGVLVRLWGTLYIGGRKATVLQCTGPYSIMRHPLYFGSLLLGLGLTAFSQNPLVLGIVILYFWLQYTATIRFEEEALTRIFGEAYTAYRRRVPCFIPRLTHYDPTPPASVDLQALKEEVRNSSCCLCLLPLLTLITLLYHAHIIQPLIRFP